MLRFDAMRGEFGPGDIDELVKLGMAMAAEQRAYVVERTRPNGTILEVRGVPLPGGGFVTTHLDVTQQRQAQALVVHKAHHDPLTNLPNRLLFRDRLQQAIARVGRGEVMAVLCLDLDHFKPVNDSYGHAAGDELLKAVANRLRATARATDTVARVGGDEFVVIQVGIRESAEAAALARRIVKVMAVPCDIAGKAMDIGASIGIAIAPRDGVEPDELLRKADKALYRCKGAGRGNFAFFDLGEGSREGFGDNRNAAKSLCTDAVALIGQYMHRSLRNVDLGGSRSASPAKTDYHRRISPRQEASARTPAGAWSNAGFSRSCVEIGGRAGGPDFAVDGNSKVCLIP